MQTVELTFESDAALLSALALVLSGALPSSLAAGQGMCKLRIAHGGQALELFAAARPGQFKLTDDPSDIKFQVARFQEVLGLTAAPPPLPELPPGDDEEPAVEAPAAGEAEEAEPDDAEMAAIQAELGTTNPLLVKLKEIQKLGVPAKIRLAEEGDLTERTLLYRMYGKLVFDGLLRNPRITDAEVAKLAKLATIATHQLLAITRKGEWLRIERVRNALLGNPRLPANVAVKLVSTLSKHELRPLLQRRDLPPPVQAAIREANLKLTGLR